MNLNDIAHGFHLYLDGNMWCAVGPHYESLAVSNAGFGTTQADAIIELNNQLKRERWWYNKSLPTIDKFTIHLEDHSND